MEEFLILRGLELTGSVSEVTKDSNVIKKQSQVTSSHSIRAKWEIAKACLSVNRTGQPS